MWAVVRQVHLPTPRKLFALHSCKGILHLTILAWFEQSNYQTKKITSNSWKLESHIESHKKREQHVIFFA